jgi:hypothetical protein
LDEAEALQRAYEIDRQMKELDALEEAALIDGARWSEPRGRNDSLADHLAQIEAAYRS